LNDRGGGGKPPQKKEKLNDHNLTITLVQIHRCGWATKKKRKPQQKTTKNENKTLKRAIE